MKALLAAMESRLKARLTYLSGQVTCATNGLIPEGWLSHGIVLAPANHTPREYPVSISMHTELLVTVHVYAEFFGERLGLMGDSLFKGILDMEQDVKDVLTPQGNADFDAFDGLVSACFWVGTLYPDVRQQLFPGWNEARLSFRYWN